MVIMRKSFSEQTLGTVALKQAQAAPALKPIDNVLKRIHKKDLEVIRSGNLSLCKNLRFFMQYPESV